MVKYKLIIEYYQKGNNNSQIATLCGCSRTVVWEVLNRFRRVRAFLSVKSTAGKIIMAPLRRVVGKK